MKPLVDGMPVELVLEEAKEIFHDETGESGAEVIIEVGFFGEVYINMD